MSRPLPSTRHRFLAGLGVSLGAACGGSALAADRLVPQGYSSIQSAINASATGDRVLVSPGTYPESINFGGRRIRVQSTAGPTATIIDAAGLNRRVVQFTGGETAESVLDGFTIRGGNPTSGTLPGHGGGILCCSISQPTIINCIVRDNVAELGGGIYMCLNSSQTRLGNVSFCNNLLGSHVPGAFEGV
jgi:serine protease